MSGNMSQILRKFNWLASIDAAIAGVTLVATSVTALSLYNASLSKVSKNDDLREYKDSTTRKESRE